MLNSVSTITMLSGLESATESHLNSLIRVFQNTDEQILNAASQSGGWSITECLWHLNSYGWYYLPQIQKRLSHPANNEEYRSGWLGSIMIQAMQPSSSIKMKAFKNHIPPNGLNAHEVVAESIEQFEQMMLCIQKARGVNLYQKVPISIGRLIRIQLGDVLQFLVAHNERHLQQAQRNLI